MLARICLLALACVGARADSYVAFHEQSTATAPAPRTLAASVLQNTVAGSAAHGAFIWLFGGMGALSTADSDGALDDLWMYNVQGRTWTQRTVVSGTGPSGLRGASMVLQGQRTAVLFGGETNAQVRKNDMYLLHLGSGVTSTPRWQFVDYNTSTSPPAARTQHSATLVPLLHREGEPDGMVVFGGEDGLPTLSARNDAYEFDFQYNTWRELTPAGAAPSPRMGHAACLVLGQLLAIFGGQDPLNGPLNDLHLLDLRRMSWISPAAARGTVPGLSWGASMVYMPGQQVVYLFGGIDNEYKKIDALYSFNALGAASGNLLWEQPEVMSQLAGPSARWGHNAYVSSAQDMMIFGGMGTGDTLYSDMWTMQGGCTGNWTLTNSYGSFSDGDGTYLANLDCRFLLQPSVAHSQVMLFFSKFDIRDEHDRVFVYDGDNVGAKPLGPGSFTGSTPPHSLTSSGSSMLVRFVTDNSGLAGAGFTASYQAVCAAGYLWEATSSLCVACPAGSHAPYANQGRCTPCPSGTYSEEEGATTCSPCDASATTAIAGSSSPSACTCQKGYFGVGGDCSVCVEGADCPGGQQIRALEGWCETDPVDAKPAFAHCCVTSECPGGAAAKCDSSVRVVDGDTCAIRYISWDTIHLLEASAATWASLGVILALLLALCSCAGLVFGFRQGVKGSVFGFKRARTASADVVTVAQIPQRPPSVGVDSRVSHDPVEEIRALEAGELRNDALQPQYMPPPPASSGGNSSWAEPVAVLPPPPAQRPEPVPDQHAQVVWTPPPYSAPAGADAAAAAAVSAAGGANPLLAMRCSGALEPSGRNESPRADVNDLIIESFDEMSGNANAEALRCAGTNA